jgi:lysophospholipase L1-like esterase
MWRNDDLEVVVEIIRDMDCWVVDLHDVMRKRVAPELLLPDGLHPSLEGQQVIAAALVEQLAEGRGR